MFHARGPRATLAAGWLLVLGGCVSAGRYVWVADYVAPPAPDDATYVIKPNDFVEVRVFNQEQMSGRARVRSDGRMTLPFLNDVEAAGYTPGVLAQQLQTRLKDFINAPIVTVSVDEAKQAPISILGKVARAGQYQLEPGMGMVQALALAGGANEFARRDGVFLLRTQPGRPAPARLRFRTRALLRGEGRESSFALQGGDVIVVE
jgi:polysaccharide export outer membrane protein